MKKKYLIIIPAFVAIAMLGAGTASAYGGGGFGKMMWGPLDPTSAAQRFDQQITQHANLLGISVDEMKTNWAQGKTVQEVATEKGISQDDLKARMKTAQQDQQKQYLQTLVSQGKITQAQADTRLKAMTDKMTKVHDVNMMGRHGRGSNNNIQPASDN